MAVITVSFAVVVTTVSIEAAAVTIKHLDGMVVGKYRASPAFLNV